MEDLVIVFFYVLIFITLSGPFVIGFVGRNAKHVGMLCLGIIVLAVLPVTVYIASSHSGGRQLIRISDLYPIFAGYGTLHVFVFAYLTYGIRRGIQAMRKKNNGQ